MRRNYYVYYLIDPVTRQPFYVGKGTGRRMYEHYRVRNKLKNPLLKAKLCKLHQQGKAVVYEKVLINVNEEEAFEKEKTLIAQHGKKIDGFGSLCNLTNGGEGNSLVWTKAKREQRSKMMKGSRGNLPIRNKPVSQYTLGGVFIADFPSAKAASEQVIRANRSYITQCCKQKRRSAGGFLWCYQDQSPQKFTKKYYRPVKQFSLDMRHIQTFESLTQAQQHTGIELHNISECCRGKTNTAGAYIWQYA